MRKIFSSYLFYLIEKMDYYDAVLNMYFDKINLDPISIREAASTLYVDNKK